MQAQLLHARQSMCFLRLRAQGGEAASETTAALRQNFLCGQKLVAQRGLHVRTKEHTYERDVGQGAGLQDTSKVL